MPRPTSLLLAVALGSLPAFTFSIPSFAQGAPAAPIDLGEDEVILKSGGMVRGTVVSLEPEKQLTIIVAPSNEQRVIPWAEVDKVERGKHKPQAAPSPAAAQPAPPAPAAPPAYSPGWPPPGYPPPGYPPPAAPEPDAVSPGAPRVHIETDDPGVTLHRVTATIGVVSAYGSAAGMVSRTECHAPCDRVIDGRGGNEFYFAGDGIPASPSFQLADQSGEIVARVSAGSTGRRFGGWMLTSIGGAGVILGATLLPLSASVSDVDSGGSAGDAVSADSMTTIGVVSLAVGGAMLVGGIILIATSGTSYELTPKGGHATGVRFSNGRLLF